MVRLIPDEIDEYLIIEVILLFLMLNFNLDLANVYMWMAAIGLLLYLTPYALLPVFPQFRSLITNFTPVTRQGSKVIKVIQGIGIGVLFIVMYNAFLNLDSLGSVFATAILAKSLFINNIVYVLIIPIVETRFFFRSLVAWGAWLTGNRTKVDIFSTQGILYILAFSGIFAFFHLNARGLNNLEMGMTFLFGAVSIISILLFQEVIQAIFAHIFVNAVGMGLLAGVTSIAFILGIAIIAYLLTDSRIRRFIGG